MLRLTCTHTDTLISTQIARPEAGINVTAGEISVLALAAAGLAGSAAAVAMWMRQLLTARANQLANRPAGPTRV